MGIMKHLFVPYDIARQLKEKGFNEPCLTTYVPRFLHPNEWVLKSIGDTSLHNEEQQSDSHILGFTGYVNSGPEHYGLKYICAPLYQQVIDWFREQHNFVIQTEVFDYGFLEKGKPCFQYRLFNKTDSSHKVYVSSTEYSNPNEALTKAIEAAIKII